MERAPLRRCPFRVSARSVPRGTATPFRSGSPANLHATTGSQVQDVASGPRPDASPQCSGWHWWRDPALVGPPAALETERRGDMRCRAVRPVRELGIARRSAPMSASGSRLLLPTTPPACWVVPSGPPAVPWRPPSSSQDPCGCGGHPAQQRGEGAPLSGTGEHVGLRRACRGAVAAEMNDSLCARSTSGRAVPWL